MHKIILMMIAATFFVLPVHAELVQQIVEYKEGETLLEGYLAYDTSFEGKRPGVLVVHEWKGLNDYAKRRTDQLAQLGYIAFAADIYGKGIRPQTVETAGTEAGKYKGNRNLLRQRVIAGLETLKAQPNVDIEKTAAIGYCFGGTAVLELARAGADIKGVVSFHGGLDSPTPHDAINIDGAVLVFHGQADPFVPPAQVAAFEEEMKKADVNYKIINYAEAVHGFTNLDNQGEIKGALYDAKADEDSWGKMLEFFEEIFG